MKKRNRIRQRGRKRDKVLQARLRAKRSNTGPISAPQSRMSMKLDPKFFTMNSIRKMLAQILARAK